MPAKDNHNANPVQGPGRHHFAITPNDTTEETNAFRGLYVGVGGDVVILSVGGEVVTYKGVPTGFVIPIQGARVNATNTTATNMVGIW